MLLISEGLELYGSNNAQKNASVTRMLLFMTESFSENGYSVLEKLGLFYISTSAKFPCHVTLAYGSLLLVHNIFFPCMHQFYSGRGGMKFSSLFLCT